MSTHTPEPWEVQPDPWPPTIRGPKSMEHDYVICDVRCPYAAREYRTEERANAARIVACVNALAGVEDPAAELARLRRVEEAAKAVLARWDTPSWKQADPTAEVMAVLRAALEGGGK